MRMHMYELIQTYALCCVTQEFVETGKITYYIGNRSSGCHKVACAVCCSVLQCVAVWCSVLQCQ